MQIWDMSFHSTISVSASTQSYHDRPLILTRNPLPRGPRNLTTKMSLQFVSLSA